MNVADTSFLVTLYDGDDPRHEDARKRFMEGPVVIGTEVLAETIGVIGHKLGRKTAREALAALAAQSNVMLEGKTDPKRVLDLYAKHAKLSFVDACVVAHCEALRCGVLAYDEGIEKLVGSN